MATQIFLSSIYLLLLAVTLICLVSAMPLGNWVAIVLSLLAAASMIFNLFLTVRTFKSMEKENESRLRKIEEDIVALKRLQRWRTCDLTRHLSKMTKITRNVLD